MASNLVFEQTIREWGNALGVRITAPIAKAACMTRGTPVVGGFMVRVLGPAKLTLA